MKNVKNNRSIILAVALLAVVIILLNYNKFVGTVSPTTAQMQTGIGTAPTPMVWPWSPMPGEKKCSKCVDTKCKFWFASIANDCTLECGDDSKCRGAYPKPPSPPPSEKLIKCMYCTKGDDGKGVCQPLWTTNKDCGKQCTSDNECKSGSVEPGTTKKYTCSYCDVKGNCKTSASSAPCRDECSANPSLCKPSTPDGGGGSGGSGGDSKNKKDCCYCKGENCYHYQGPSYCTCNCAQAGRECKKPKKSVGITEGFQNAMTMVLSWFY